MKKSSFVLLVLAATALVGCGGGATSSAKTSSAAASSAAASSTAASSSTMSQVNGVDFFQLEETDIGTSDTVASGKLSAFSSTNPLKISMSVRKRSIGGVAHIPEDRQKYGLALDFTLKDNLVLQRYFESRFNTFGFINERNKAAYAEELIDHYDIRSSLGGSTIVRSMSGGNQQKAIVGRELDRNTPLLIAVQPTRGLDVGAIEYIHKQIVAGRDRGNGVLLVSLELEEVMNLSDRILVMFKGEIVAELNPKETTVQEIGLYMSGAKRMDLTTHQVIFDATKGGAQHE